MKKILIITYYWPPAGGPGVQRWLKFAKYLPENGWEPIILTVDENYASYPQKDSSLLDEVSGVEVHKTKSFEILNLYSSLNKDKQVPYGGFSNEGNPSFLKKVSRFIRGNFFIPDPRKGWNSYAYSEAKRIIEEQEIDIVVTTGPPQSTHLIGLKLKKNNVVKKWIADFRDPWTDIFYYNKFYPTKLSLSIDRKYERLVMLNSDVLITVSEGFKQLFCNRYDVSDKFHVISNGYDGIDFEDKGNSIDISNEIVYTGTISNDYPLNSIIEIAKSTEAFKFKFIGSVPEELKELVEKEGLQEKFTFKGTVSHSEAIEEMTRAALLLLLVPEIPQNEGIVPGKVFEYIHAQRPILAIGSENGDLSKILNDTKSGKLVDFSDIDGLKELIRKFEKDYINGALKVESIDIEKFSRKALTNKLSNVLQEL